jgi:hypothetical protein
MAERGRRDTKLRRRDPVGNSDKGGQIGKVSPFHS